MYVAGNIIYFDPFYFPSGAVSKPKYLIILKLESTSTFIGGLSTRTDHVPNLIEKNHGCINDDSKKINCYCFEKEKIITQPDFGFPIETFLYGEELEIFDIGIFKSIYKIENEDYTIIGKLVDNEFDQLFNCMKNSCTAPRKIRRKLGAII